MSLCMVALESYVNLPDVAAEMAEKSNRSSCFVKFCCLGIIAQAADPDCEVVAGNSNRNSGLLREKVSEKIHFIQI